MDIRGIGDTQGFRRLFWLFGTTIVAPAAVLGVMALGAAGHSQWNATEVEAREVRVQTPLIARLLDARGVALDQEVRRLSQSCPNASCAAPSGVATWRADASWSPDPDALSDWANEQLTTLADTPHFRLEVVDQPAPDSRPLAGPFAGYFLAPDPPLVTVEQARRPLEAFAAVTLLGILLTGVVIGLRSAAREMKMSRRQTEMVSRVSHELRTPMTSIRMFVDTLGSSRLDESRAQECLDLLSQETERLSRRIEDVLLWARMEAGARVYHREEVPPAELAREALDALRTQYLHEPERPVVATQLPEDLPALRVDRDAVVEALLNLLVNAVRHTPEPRQIVLGARADGRRVGLSVADNGPGIDRRDRRRIFEKFYQAEEDDDASLTRGAGLGLAIVRAIARAHGGRVELDSDAERGSTFTLWLPVA
jgi:signal transduction histidine kinase